MTSVRMRTAAFGMLWVMLSGCAGGMLGGGRAAELPHTFVRRGVEVTTTSLEKGRTFRWGEVTLSAEGLAGSDIWLVAQVSIKEVKGKTAKISWSRFLRIKTASGKSIKAAGIRFTSGGPAKELGPGERKSIKLFFQMNRNDFPVRLRFMDGAVVENFS